MTAAPDNGGDRQRNLWARLAHPSAVLPIADTLSKFLMTEVVIEARAPALFEEIPELPDRVRGALGRALERRAARESGNNWFAGAPTAWDVFFGPPVGAPGLEPTRPMVLRTERRGADVSIILRLFGFADCWLTDAADGLVEALATGIALKRDADLRVPLKPRGDPVVRRTWGLTIPPLPPRATLSCMTPLAFRAGHRQIADLDRLGSAMARRLAALARWQDIAIDPADLRRLSKPALWRITNSDLTPARWVRFSSTQRRGQPVHGLIGKVNLDRVTERGWLWLSLAAELHAGSGCASGLGQVALFAGK